MFEKLTKMPNVKGDGIRGLAVFISDIRNCKSKEAEVKRINKELANIRSKFKGDKVLDGYSKKKYVCKLLFIFLLGNEVDFGYMEAVNLMTSNRYSEKQIGYLYVSVMLRTCSDLFPLIIQNIRTDLASHNPIFQNMALQCIANTCNSEIIGQFVEPVARMLVTTEVADDLKQSAALALLRMARHNPAGLSSAELSWLPRITHLINSQHLGVAMTACSLIDVLCKTFPNEFKGVISLAISRMSRIVNSGSTDFQDYTYYFMAAPWFLIALMKLLQNYPPPEHSADRTRLNECLDVILSKGQEPMKSKKVQHSNAKFAVLFEAITLIIHYDCEASSLVRAARQLGQFLNNRETNMRYLALETLCLLATSEFSHDAVIAHKRSVVDSLKNERDLAVRQKALHMMYAMCDKSNAESIVKEMLEYIKVAGYQLKEDLVWKIAILAEKYATDFNWYVDVMLTLICTAGEFVAEEVWHRVIQVVVNKEEVQCYAARTCFEFLSIEPCHETMVKVGGYLLGEYGNLIAADSKSGPEQQLKLLHSKFASCGQPARYLLLSTYMKFANLYPEIKPKVEAIFRSDHNLRSTDSEIQQRATEYLAMCNICNSETLATVLEIMPVFPDKVISPLHRSKGGGDDEKIDRSNGQMSNSPKISKKTIESSALISMSELQDSPIRNSGFRKFALRNIGVLWEDEMIQMGFKDTYKDNQGRLQVFIGNKSQDAMENFTWRLPYENVQNDANNPLSFTWANSFPSNMILPGTQMAAVIAIEILGPFAELPPATISYNYKQRPGQTEDRTMPLPVFLSKFSKPVTMDKTTFAGRWQNMSAAGQESSRSDTINQSLDEQNFKQRVSNFGWSVMTGIDNQNNICGAGIISLGQGQQSGVMYRLEMKGSNKTDNNDRLLDLMTCSTYCLTVRSAKPGIAKVLCDLFYW